MKLNSKNKKALFELSRNSTITSKELGRRLRTSQQSANYLIHSLEERGVIGGYTTLLDTSRFGLINFVVFFRLKSFSKENAEKILNYLFKSKDVTRIERFTMWDFQVFFAAENISHFNKSLKSFLGSFGNNISRSVVLPVIVKHVFDKKYLISTNISSDNIIFGDREIIKLTPTELKVCDMLRKNARKGYSDMSKEASIDIKTVSQTRKRLEKNEIIKGYSLLIDYSASSIERGLIFVKMKEHDIKSDKRFTSFCRGHENIVALTKVIGEWDALVEVEGINIENFLNDFREKNQDIIYDYQLIKSEQIIREIYLPDSIF